MFKNEIKNNQSINRPEAPARLSRTLKKMTERST